MNVFQKGQPEMTTPICITPKNTKANVHYPATAGIGIAYMPNNKLTLAFDADWTDWSYLYEVVTEIEGAANLTTYIDSRDTIDFRVGLEFKPDEGTALRCGFLFPPTATPSEWILPQKPDYDRLRLIL